MLPDWLRPDGFPAALRAYGRERCSWIGQTLCLGLAPTADFRRRPLVDTPAAPSRVSFFEAPVQAALIRALVMSPRARHIEALFIGTSHDYAGKGAADYDMTAAVAALKGAKLPLLSSLSLGDMELLFNGHRLFGDLGAVDHVFAAAPALSRLHLHGKFALPRPVGHSRLTELVVEVDDVGITGGPLDRATVLALLASDFPGLTTCDLSIGPVDGGAAQDLPAGFLPEGAFPALQRLEITGLTAGAAADLARWKARRGIG